MIEAFVSDRHLRFADDPLLGPFKYECVVRPRGANHSGSLDDGLRQYIRPLSGTDTVPGHESQTLSRESGGSFETTREMLRLTMADVAAFFRPKTGHWLTPAPSCASSFCPQAIHLAISAANSGPQSS